MGCLRIEIKRKDWNGLWDLRIGDLDGSSEHLNIPFEEVLSDIESEMKSLELKQVNMKSQNKSKEHQNEKAKEND